jgi:hypothetical protein
MTIDAFHGLAGRQAEDEIRVGAQFVGDDAGDQGGGRFLIRLYNDFHRGDCGKNRSKMEANGYGDYREERSIWKL